MPTDTVGTYGVTKITLPDGQTQSGESQTRHTKYGEPITANVLRHRTVQAIEGTRYMTSNPTPGTGIAGIAATGAFSDAESLLYVRNGYATGGKFVILDWLKVIATVAGTNGTDHRYAMKLDATGTNRYTSGGSLLTAVNVNGGSGETASAEVRFGALITTAATGTARLLSNGIIRSQIIVANDTFFFAFGGDPAGFNTIVPATAIAGVVPCSEVIIAPQQDFVFSLFATAQTVGTSYEMELHWTER